MDVLTESVTLDIWILAAALVLALLIGGAATWAIVRQQNRRALRQRFGPEYDRTIERAGDQRAAETDLQAREERVATFSIRPLSRAEYTRFAEEWHSVQGRFVDDPRGATRDADRLVTDIMTTRGYPMADFEQRASDLSVDHPRVVEHYRAAHSIAVRNEQGDVDTELLRQAFVHYRTLADDLLEIDGVDQPERMEAGHDGADRIRA